MGALGHGIDRSDGWRGARVVAEPRRFAAERCVRGDARLAHVMGAALLSGLLATCPGRASAWPRRTARAADQWRPFLGSGRAGRRDPHAPRRLKRILSSD